MGQGGINRRAVIGAGALGGLGAWPRFAMAQAWPDHPIRMIVPLAAASAVDVAARLVADRMSEDLGQSIVVENQPGASGIGGMRTGARAPADEIPVTIAGCTLL